MNLPPLGKSDGFTLIEVVTVIVLVTILSVVLLAYYRHRDNELIAHTQSLKSCIRYAQARAMNTSSRWGIQYDDSEHEYWLFKDPDTTIKIALPGQSAASVDLDDEEADLNLDITGADFSLTFDGWGRPALTGAGRAFINGQFDLNLNRDGLDGDTITVTENTGFIP